MSEPTNDGNQKPDPDPPPGPDQSRGENQEQSSGSVFNDPTAHDLVRSKTRTASFTWIRRKSRAVRL